MVDININLKVSGHEKLRDYLASGIGATAGPLLAAFAPWRALQEGKAKVIAAKADAEVQKIQVATDVEVQRIQAATANGTSQLIAKEQDKARQYVVTPDALEPDGSVRIGFDDAQRAMEFQARKRLMNVGAIAGHAAEELKDKEVSDHNPDPDWIARFFDGAQDVSSEELQKLWGRILAGEVKSPGQTSLRTLSILRNMTQQEAQDFSTLISTLMRFRIFIFISNEGVKRILGDHFNSLTVHFSNIGLLHGFGICRKITLENNGKCWIAENGSYVLIIEGLPGQQFTMSVGENSCVITDVGLELAKLCECEPDLQYLKYLSHFARFLAKDNCKLKIAKIIGKDSEDFRISDMHTIEPFVEPEERDQDQQESNNAE